MHCRTARHPGVVIVLGLLLATACGGSDEEAAFQEATDSLGRAQQVVETARAEVQEEEEAVASAQAELDEARETLAKATRRLEEARAAVGRHATDEVLFRTVQTKLLQDAELGEVAIRARVEKGVVILSGQVTEESLREHAEDLAAATPGVVGVENRIAVSTPAPPAEG